MSFIRRVLNFLGLTKEVSIPERVARESFKKEFPKRKVCWSGISAAKEKESIVFVAWLGDVIPAHLEFYSFDMSTQAAKRLTPEEARPYYPKNYR